MSETSKTFDHGFDRRDEKKATLPDWFPKGKFKELIVKGEASKDAAFAKMMAVLKDEEYIDNERYSLIDDEEGMVAYEKAIDDGCCGSYDTLITFTDGKKAVVGCNYGH